MKKIIAMLVVATMLLTGIMAITASAVDAAVYTVDAVKDGDTLDVTVSFNSTTPVAIAYVYFVYNADALEVVSGSLDAAWAVGDDDTFKVKSEDEGIFLQIEANDMDEVGITAQGTMFTVSFDIKDASADYGFDVVPVANDPFNHVAVGLTEALPIEVVVNASEVTTAPETTAPVADETTAPVADETTAPVADETTAPVADETTAPVADETTAPDASETKAPETTKPVAKPQSPQTGDSMVFIAVIAVLALAACSTVVVVRSKKASK